jgi:chitinase
MLWTVRLRFVSFRCVTLGYLALTAAFLFCPSAQATSLAFWHHRGRPLVVGYFPGWGQPAGEHFYVKTMISNRSIKLLDQINYSQGSVAGGRCSLANRKNDLDTIYTSEDSVNGRPDNPGAPFRGYFHQLKELKHRYPHLKILISLEGAPAGFIEGAQPANRRAFVASCVDTFLRGHFAPGINEPGVFDGIDIDWESPQQDEAADYLALIAEFRRQMDALRPGLRLSVALGDTPLMLPGTDFAAISALVDQVGIMNYDYTGPWSPTTGFIAPLYSNPEDPGSSESIARSIATYRAQGVPVKKMLMGLPFYGYSWTKVEEDNDGLFQSGDGVRDDKPYHYIRSLAASSSIHRDPRTRAPWLFNGDIFWTYEDPISVRYKVSYAARGHLAGIMIWELSGDTEDAELLRVAHHTLRRPMHDSFEEEAASELPPTTFNGPLQ